MILNRPEPALPVQHVQTFAIRRPKTARLLWDTVPCERAQCEAYLHGWVTRVDPGSDQGQAAATYVRTQSGRRYTAETEPGGLLAFTFPAGQPCFALSSRHPGRGYGWHDVPTEAEPLYVVRDGDWRGNPTGRRRVHVSGTEWVEEFGEHQQGLADRIERG